MVEVDLVLGNGEKLLAESYADFGVGTSERVRVNDIMSVRETASQMVDCFEGPTRGVRAFLQVQNGCDHRCTFCIIPFGRGNSRSVPMGEIVRQARALCDAGFRELVLTGVDLTGFGADLPGQPSLGQLCRRLLALIPELKRLRLSSLDPVEIDDELWRLIAEDERLLPHLHLSIQAGDDLILKRMKRRHSRAEALAVCRRARSLRPQIALGADLIAGFPTEDETMFQRTRDFIDEAGLDYLHVFPFSARVGTPAARMPQPPRAVIRERAARLREAGAMALARALAARIGTVAQVLVERPGFGRSEHWAPVRFSGEAAVGSVAAVKLLAAGADTIEGTLP